jgi:glycerol-3-phosphate dehydrogenase subunit C
MNEGRPKEGSTEAPIRHPIRWQDPQYTDMDAVLTEMTRVFDICHGCRRCFNLCDSFPRLFDLIDESESGELDSVSTDDYKSVVDACTLCDMCFMTKCPYVPPHEFDLDFPHLMLRYRAAERKAGKGPSFAQEQMTRTDRNGRLAGAVAPIANWATRTGNSLTRPMMESVAGIHREAALPVFHGRTFAMRARKDPPAVNASAPASGRKAVLYATCFVNYNNPGIGVAAQAVLARNGVATEVAYPQCCGMPQLEHGDVADVARRARAVAADLGAWIDKGYDVVALTPSCALMLKFEWPLIVPDDPAVRRLADATADITEYVVDIARKEGLAEGLRPLEGGIAVHLACHARAQNMGPKAADMLRLIPDAEVTVIERCSGHGGSWGVMKENFPVALKVGRPAARQAIDSGCAHVVSECPLAGEHIVQGMARGDGGSKIDHAPHPIELLARAYGFPVEG